MHYNSENGSRFRLARRIVSVVRHEGIASAVRRVAWKVHYNRFERLRKVSAARGQTPSVIRLVNKEFELHPVMEGVSDELSLFGVHEPVATRVYLQHLKAGDHVVDVGSNIGYYLRLASERVGSGGRVLGFEPAPAVYEILKRNIERSSHRNIEAFPWAMGARNGTMQFYESEIPNWGSLIQDSGLRQTGCIDVEGKTLDEVVSTISDFRPNALRMDVEGGELGVLEGSQQVLREYKPCLFIEFHNFAIGWHAARAAIRNLGEMGYSSGVLIQRTWDQPWMSKWIRERRCWAGGIGQLLERVEFPGDPLVDETLSLILRAPTR